MQGTHKGRKRRRRREEHKSVMFAEELAQPCAGRGSTFHSRTGNWWLLVVLVVTACPNFLPVSQYIPARDSMTGREEKSSIASQHIPPTLTLRSKVCS